MVTKEQAQTGGHQMKTTTMPNIDWALLREQKHTLLDVIDKSVGQVEEDLTGILQFIDAVQDAAAANSEIGITEVFGGRVRVADATNAQIDYLVAKCEGYLHTETSLGPTGTTMRVVIDGYNVPYDMLYGCVFSPSTNWAQGGPIIDRERIATDGDADGDQWAASVRDAPCYWVGPTSLIAAMRCYIACKLGETAEVPDGLE